MSNALLSNGSEHPIESLGVLPSRSSDWKSDAAGSDQAAPGTPPPCSSDPTPSPSGDPRGGAPAFCRTREAQTGVSIWAVLAAIASLTVTGGETVSEARRVGGWGL